MSTSSEKKSVRAVGLVSGGLDSTLALKVVADQGIEVIPVYFHTGFCRSSHHRTMDAFGLEQDPRRLRNDAASACAQLGLDLRVVDVSEGYLDVILKPKHGYGANMNPCVDCRAHMLKAAARLMRDEGADFVFTGEVLGQRPMSQHLRAMKVIEKDAGLEGLILRPLSARLLEPTLPERDGRVDRERLLRIQGRGRKEQMRLAEEAGLKDIPSPAGGCCFLTDEVYSSRFHDHLIHLPEGQAPTDAELQLMMVGRHFRLSPRLKLVVGREEAENRFLQHFFPEAGQMEAADLPGPLAVWQGEATDDEMLLMARTVARYGKGRSLDRVTVKARRGDEEFELEVEPLRDDAELEPYRIPERFDPWERRPA